MRRLTTVRLLKWTAGYWREFWRRLGRACWATYRDGCLGYAKAAAYSALLSFFPLLTTTTTILVQANAQAVSHAISNFLFEVVPPGTEQLIMFNFLLGGTRPAALLVGAGILSLWAASGATLSLMEGFHAAYRIPDRRSFFRKRVDSLMLVFSGIVPSLMAAALVIMGERVERFVFHELGLLPESAELAGWLDLASYVMRTAVALSTVVLVTVLLYYFGVDRKQSLRRLWPGALLATAFWLVTTQAFAWYVRNIANYNVLYGSVGAVIALIVWMYLLAVIALIGCEYNAEAERGRLAATS